MVELGETQVGLFHLHRTAAALVRQLQKPVALPQAAADSRTRAQRSDRLRPDEQKASMIAVAAGNQEAESETHLQHTPADTEGSVTR